MVKAIRKTKHVDDWWEGALKAMIRNASPAKTASLAAALATLSNEWHLCAIGEQVIRGRIEGPIETGFGEDDQRLAKAYSLGYDFHTAVTLEEWPKALRIYRRIKRIALSLEGAQ